MKDGDHDEALVRSEIELDATIADIDRQAEESAQAIEPEAVVEDETVVEQEDGAEAVETDEVEGEVPSSTDKVVETETDDDDPAKVAADKIEALTAKLNDRDGEHGRKIKERDTAHTQEIERMQAQMDLLTDLVKGKGLVKPDAADDESGSEGDLAVTLEDLRAQLGDKAADWSDEDLTGLVAGSNANLKVLDSRIKGLEAKLLARTPVADEGNASDDAVHEIFNLKVERLSEGFTEAQGDERFKEFMQTRINPDDEFSETHADRVGRMNQASLPKAAAAAHDAWRTSIGTGAEKDADKLTLENRAAPKGKGKPVVTKEKGPKMLKMSDMEKFEAKIANLDRDLTEDEKAKREEYLVAVTERRMIA